MIWRRYLAAAAVLTAGMALAGEPALAQNFLQRLFGWGSSAPAASRVPDIGEGRMGVFGYERPRDGFGSGFEEDYGTYRTVCVRMCDGFYFPVGDKVRRARFYQDNRACQRRCDGEARLFYYSTTNGSPETMVDLAGRRYVDLPTAFKYRKTLVSGCACKPAPWSPQEAARHQSYAQQEAHGGDPEYGVVDIVAERRRAALARAQEGSGPYYEEGHAPAEQPEAPAAATAAELEAAYEAGYDAGPPVDFYADEPEGPPRFHFSGRNSGGSELPWKRQNAGEAPDPGLR